MRFLVSPGGFVVLSLVGFVPWGRFQERVVGMEWRVSCWLCWWVGGGGGSRAQSQADEKVEGGVKSRSWQGLKD